MTVFNMITDGCAAEILLQIDSLLVEDHQILFEDYSISQEISEFNSMHAQPGWDRQAYNEQGVAPAHVHTDHRDVQAL